MKIAAVMGTYRKNGAGAKYVRLMEDAFRALPGVELEYIWLGDYNLHICRGCMFCYELGEKSCPLKDGYLDAIARINEADAVIFYSPTYALSMSGLMKTFFDRSSYVLHRPYFKGRHALVLTASASWGERPALRTLRRIVSMMGFSMEGEVAIVNSRYEGSLKYQEKIRRKLVRMANWLTIAVKSGKPVKPTVLELMAFQFQKSAFGRETGGCANDRLYWRQSGWSARESAYYCRARISPVKALVAKGLSVLFSKGRLVL
jgi:multimeric flavodoxin WrbA